MRLGYAYSRYPVLSQTFCDSEMLELQRRGHTLVIGSLYPPKTQLRHEYLAQLRAPIHYAPKDLDAFREKAQRERRWPAALVREHEKKYGADYKAALRARNAVFFVDLFERQNVRHFHVHFANRAAHTAIFVKAISGIPFSVTAHGQDFMTDLGNVELLRDICREAEFVAAETDYSTRLLAWRCPESASKIFRVYNGIDLSRFPLRANRRSGDPIRLLSIGRLVPFKGFDVLVDACAQLGGLDFRCEIIGIGPLQDELEARVRSRNLEMRVHLAGERSQNHVLAALKDCDIFVLASNTDERGASDVFPTVIAEAMAAGKPVVSTLLAGIPELVTNNQTGLLVPPGDATALATAIQQLAGDENLRTEFGAAGRRRIEENFTIAKTIEPLLERFEKVQRGFDKKHR